MIFKQIDEILTGRKTQARYVVKAGEMMTRYKGFIHTKSGLEYPRVTVGLAGVVTTSGRTKWILDASYAIVPKHGAPAIKEARILIVGIRCQNLQDISKQDAQAEGVNSIDEYRWLWEPINGANIWNKNPLVWVLTFEVVRS